jgi:hypothetical protein
MAVNGERGAAVDHVPLPRALSACCKSTSVMLHLPHLDLSARATPRCSGQVDHLVEVCNSCSFRRDADAGVKTWAARARGFRSGSSSSPVVH